MQTAASGMMRSKAEACNSKEERNIILTGLCWCRNYVVVWALRSVVWSGGCVK